MRLSMLKLRRSPCSVLLAGLAVLCCCPAFAEPAPAGHLAFYERVQPLLVAKCVACHGPEKQEGQLRLDSAAAARAGGDRGPAVVPGDLEQSLLVQAISFRDPELQMPPKQKLTDAEIATLTDWVQAGAAWPEPATVLFEDEPEFLNALAGGNGRQRLITDGAHAGQAALGITPLQREASQIPGWAYVIREFPQPGEYRYLRLAWKKRGEGSVMVELASSGAWPDAQVAAGRYVAGPNTTGWAAKTVADTAPAEWSVVTFDLWKDLGDFTLTGLAPTCDRGEEAYFDSIILGPSVEALDAYRPRPHSPAGRLRFGAAFADPQNPIHQLFEGARLDLWSLRSPAATSASQAGPAGRMSAIDEFVQARLPAEAPQLAPAADRRTLIRRLTLDLTGLPPAFAEVEAFVADASPQAYEKLVDRLLDSPQYGERQARLWLDVVRYADTHGYERDEFRPLIWQYRDYVVRSFNQDKPFDEFIREQLAGDQLVSGPPQTAADADKLIATGFLRLGQWDSTATIFQEEPRLQAEMMADLTNTTASAFLGLTLSCCQCHDHKYDPLSQADHFRLRAFFAGMRSRDDLPISLATEQAEIDAHNAGLNERLAPLKAEIEQIGESDTQRREELQSRLNELETQRRHPRLAMGVDEQSPATETFVLAQGDYASPREAVQPGFPTVLGSHPEISGNRRAALADWIAAPDNPWTARVIVNRVWQQHFGSGLVATPNDFGYSGARPTHPELLDWLTLEFTHSGWSLKSLHRLIVTSATYRQSSAATVLQSTDPDNQLLGRQNVRRLDAEMLRDSLLAVSGLLKPHSGGQPLWPPVPEELLHAQPAILEAIEGKDGGRRQGWYADPVELTDVRSLFLVRKRCLPVPFLQAFDLPDTTVSCARRDSTVVAPQALMLLNSPEGVRYAGALADRLRSGGRPLDFNNAEQTRELVDQLFQLTLLRPASATEHGLAGDMLLRHRDRHAQAGPAEQAAQQALVDLCRALLNLNEFLYID